MVALTTITDVIAYSNSRLKLNINQATDDDFWWPARREKLLKVGWKGNKKPAFP